MWRRIVGTADVVCVRKLSVYSSREVSAREDPDTVTGGLLAWRICTNVDGCGCGIRKEKKTLIGLIGFEKKG